MQMSSRYKGICYILVSAFCFTMMGVCVRLAGDLPVVEKAFFRNVVAVIVAVFILHRDKVHFRPNMKQTKTLLVRSICGTVGIWGNFYALSHIPISDALMLNKLSPFFVVFFSWIFLKEKIKPIQLLCLCGALIGTMFILKPGIGDMISIPALVGAFGGICAGMAYTQVRKAGMQQVPSAYVVLFFSAFSTVIAIPFACVSFQMPTLRQFFILILAGVFASGGQFSVTTAYIHAPGKEISIYDYSALIFSAISGFIFFHEIADGFSFIGYGIILAMAVLMFLYNNGKLGKGFTA